MVDLPQPDSPTRPSVSPRRTCERHAGDGGHVADGAPEHAAADREVLHQVAWRRAAAPRRSVALGATATVSVTWRSPAGSMTTSAATRSARSTSARSESTVTLGERLGVVAGRAVGVAGRPAAARAPRSSQRPGEPGEAAARVERAARRASDERRRRALDRHQRLVADVVEPGQAGQQAERVRVAGLVEDLVGGAHLHLAAGVHHHHLVGEAGHHAEVVGDEDDRRVDLVLDVDAAPRAPGPAR